MELFLIDAIGPFFRGYDKERINWSKIPFDNLEKGGSLDEVKFEQIHRDFDVFCHKVSSIGYNAITLDDVAHLYIHPSYPKNLQEKIQAYREQYRKLFATAHGHGLKVFITSDVMFYHPSIVASVGRNPDKIIAFLSKALNVLFEDFPEIAGIILRIGESDGLDVRGDFLSRVVVRTPKQAREVVKGLLPVFEKHRRWMVFRTWSVGTYRVGDLIWNRNTFASTFGKIDSDRLIISMKYGETDFFRFLPLNKIFYYTEHKKIIELQARREYEGFGEYPSFVGWDYEKYSDALQHANNVIGACVWCQTGGWSPFRNLTFVENSSVWNEINTYVTLKIFKERMTTEAAIEAWYRENVGDSHWRLVLQLLQLSDEVIKDLLYIDEFANRKIFFRRLRMPPLLWVYWDHIVINHTIRRMFRHYVFHRECEIMDAYASLDKIKTMHALADTIGLPTEGIEFQYDTFEILAAARKYFFEPFTQEKGDAMHALKDQYDAKYPNGYKVHMTFKKTKIAKHQLRVLLAIFFRYQRGYRIMDKLFTLRMLKLMYPVVRLWQRRWVPDFARNQAMGIQSIFK